MTINPASQPPGINSFFTHQTQYQDLKKGERFLSGLKAFLSVFFSLGIALSITPSRNCIKAWYEEYRTGKRKITVLNPTGHPSIPGSQAASTLGGTILSNPTPTPGVTTISTPTPILPPPPTPILSLPPIFIPEPAPIPTPDPILSPPPSDLIIDLSPPSDPYRKPFLFADSKPEAPLPPHVRNFLDEARKDPSIIPDMNQFEEVLKHGNSITNHIDKTTFFEAAETLSNNLILNGNRKKAFQIRVQAAQAVSPVAEFANLGITPPNGDPVIGYRIQPLGTRSIKNHTLKVQKRTYANGKNCIRIEARLQENARSSLEQTLNALKNDANALSSVLPPGWGGIAIDPFGVSKKIVYHKREIQNGVRVKQFTESTPFELAENNRVIHFKGVGKVFVGSDPNYHTEYKHLTIELDPHVNEKEAGEKLHIILAALGLGTTSSHSRPEDIEKIKVMQIFRHCFPIESNQDQYKNFEGTVEQLKNAISAEKPIMKNKFHYYLKQFPKKMYQQEVNPGQFIWCIDGLAQEAKNLGAKTLMSTTNNIGTIASMLKTGALSSQERMSAGITETGFSTPADFKSGGAEAIFTTLITKKTMDTVPITNCKYGGSVKIFYDLKLLERVGYGYSSDCYGAKDHRYNNPNSRHNIQGLVNKVNTFDDSFNLTANEVCVHSRISPEYIKGILVDSEANKQLIIQSLQKENLIKNGCVRNVPINKFIRVADWNGKYKEEYWT